MTFHRRRSGGSNTTDSTTGTVSVTWNPDINAYECYFPYNATFIAWIKAQIPTNYRSYDFDRSRPPAQHHKWMFEQATLETVIMPMMKAMFQYCVFKFIDKAKVDEYNQGFRKTLQVDTDFLKKEFRTLVREAGVDLELSDRKQYLKAAMYYHPDRNPDNAAKMSRLNEIWSTVFEVKTVVQE